MAVITPEKAGGKNVVAFLDTLKWSELGKDIIEQSDDGYNVIVGSLPGKLITFDDYSKHPNKLIKLPRYGISSTAAGAYQFLFRTWNNIVRIYGFRGRFTPEAQDLAAIKLLMECGAFPHIQAGNVGRAIQLASPIWASLPGAGYGQREHALVKLLEIYKEERASEEVPETQLLAMYERCGGVCA